MNFHWLRALSAWQARFVRHCRGPAKRARPTYKPTAESLEDRWLPSTWNVLISNTTNKLNDVWGSSDTNLYAVGLSGMILHSGDGTTWAAQTSNTTQNLIGIWGNSATNLYAVGWNGTILHSGDGTTWAAQTSNTTQILSGIWGSSATNLYAVGWNGTILHSSDGTTWAAQTSNTTNTLFGIWGSSATNLYAVGDNGTILHSGDGSTWAAQTSNTTQPLLGVWGSSATNLYAAGNSGTILHSGDGSTWAAQTSNATSWLEPIWGSSATNLYAAGDNGTILHSGDGSTWAAQTSNTTNPLYGIWGGIRTVYAVGENGTILSSSLDSLAFTSQPSSTTAGTTFSTTVTVQGPDGSTDTSFSGNVTVSIASGSGSFTGGSTTTVAAVNGVATFSNLAINTADTYTLSATATGGITGPNSTNFTISAGAVSQLAFAPLSAVSAGAAQDLTVKAEDQYGNVVSTYTGTVSFSSNDPQGAILPGTYPFGSGDNGVHTFHNGVTFKTAGSRNVSVSDGSNTGLSNTVTVSAAAASQLVLTGLTGAVAGAPQTLTVTAKDTYGNTATGYTGTITFTSTDPQVAGLPASYTFTTGTGMDNGRHAFTNVMLKTAGSQTVTATDSANSVTGRSAAVTITPGTARTLALTGLGNVTAGTAQTLTVTAKDAYGNTATGYTGTIRFSSTDSQISGLPASYRFTTGTGRDNGRHAFSNVMLKTAGSQTVTATDRVTSSITGTSPALTITPAAAASFNVFGYISPATAGAGQNVTVTAQDAYGNTATGYTGTVVFASSDGRAVLPPNSTLTSGTGTFGVTLKTAGTQSVTATDSNNSNISGSEVGITITAASAVTLVVSGFASPTTAGITQTVVVTAQDAYGNTATGYTGTVHFASSDGQASLPANYTFTGGDAGTKGFLATLKTAGTQTITATDTMTGGPTGTQSGITITAAAPVGIIVVGFSSPATAGVSQNLTVTAQDQFGNTAPSYTGTVHFTSTDSRAGLPADYTFAGSDNGVYTFSITLKTAGTQAITATDTMNTGFTATRPGIAVSPAAANTFTVAGFASTTAGVGRNLTVTAFDAYGNLATGYNGTVHFTSTDPQAALPFDYTFTGGDAGVHTFTATLKTAGSQSLTATDTHTGTLTGSQGGILISPAAASTLSLTGFSGAATAGAGLSVTVTLRDAFGNLASGYTGTVHFTSTDPQAALPADYTFVSADAGVHTFSVNFKTAGGQSTSVTDTVSAALHAASGTQTVLPAAGTVFRLGAPAGSIVGNFFTVTLTVFDAFGNLATGYTGTVHFNSSDGTALLPADYTFTAADAASHSFPTATAFHRLGTPTLTAGDTANSGVSGSTTVTSSNPLEEVFVIGTDGQVYGQRFDAAGNPMGGYFLIGPGQAQSLSVGHDAAGRPEVFVVGLDHQVYAHQFDAAGNPAGNYFQTQPGQVQALTVGRDAVGRPELFVIGLDSQVWTQHFDANGNPAGPYTLATVGQVRSLAVGRDAGGQPEAFVIGLDSQVWALKFDSNGNAIGGYFLTQIGRVSSLSVGEDAAFNPEVFVIGLDHQVWAQKFTAGGDSASGYFLTQPGQVKSLSVGQDGGFNPEVFVIGLDNQVYAQQFDANDNSASGYFLAQPGQVRNLQVGQDAANDPELVVTGLDDQAYGLKLNAAGSPVSGYFLMEPGVIETFTVAF